MPQVISKDGTKIAYEKTGQGPAVFLVDGALAYRGNFGLGSLAAALSSDFTAYTYDRRGRGKSTDTVPYAIKREIEDIDALIDEAGGLAYLYGISSGAVLALKAASQLEPEKVTKLALNQPPVEVGEEAEQQFSEFRQEMDDLLKAGKRDEVIEFFLADMVPPEMLEDMKRGPEWPLMEGVAPTLAYDNAILDDGTVPVDDAKRSTMPTLVLDGSVSPPSFRQAADTLATTMPHATRQTLEGEPIRAAPETMAPVLTEFFTNHVQDTQNATNDSHKA
ncbi:alpha/beta fold hydrolase [Haladaptatus halobius]|uniref:alpha/beta fold hydrolase n=1 Tax=Haladaptatus halobius TaxID=2884875 RepID=UPI001D0ACB81|nr:alpha/beta hydrolase [Haladaptatus halobius]